MKVKVSKNAGFCIGVKRAVEIVLKTVEKHRGKKIFTWGPIINNPQTVEMLRERDVEVMEKITDGNSGDIVIIRSHGISPSEREKLENAGFEVLDATCPKVALVHKIVREHCKDGNPAIIIGDANHPEVLGIKGEAPENVYIIKDSKFIDSLNIPSDNILVVAQTTMDTETFDEITSSIRKKYPRAKIVNTLCTETSNRQKEIGELMKDTDAFVVVGGKNSGNTKRLYERAMATKIKTFWVESHTDLNVNDFSNINTVVVLSGASTPHWVIEQVVERLETMNRKFVTPWKWRWLKNCAYLFLRANGFSSLAGGSLTFIIAKFAGMNTLFARALASTLILLGIQNLYQHREWQGIALMDPSKIQFIRQNRRILVPISILALIAGMLIAALVGLSTALLSLACISIGLIYWIIPVFERILPSSTKDLTIILVWWLLITGLGAGFPPPLPIALNTIAVLGARGLVFSLKEAETDRILQRKTITAFLGEKTSIIIGGIAILALFIIQLFLGKMIPQIYITAFLLWLLSISVSLRLFRHGTYIEASADSIIVILSIAFLFA